MDLLTIVDNTLSHARLFLRILEEKCFRQPLGIFFRSCIGHHTHHNIEFLIGLICQCESGEINYDHRRRKKTIEDWPELAMDALDTILRELGMHDLHQRLTLAFTTYDYDKERYQTVETISERERVFSIEHVIHHLVIRKIGLKLIAPESEVPRNVAVVPFAVRFYGQRQS